MSTSRRNVLWSALGAEDSRRVPAQFARAAPRRQWPAQAAGAAAVGAGWLNVRDGG